MRDKIEDDIVYFKNAHLMFPYLIYVKSDVMGISKSIKAIDKSFFVMFNPRTQRYEVHSSDQLDGTLCVEIPYDELDSRAVDYVQKTKIENLKKIMAEIEAENEKIRFDKEKNYLNTTREAAKEIYSYCMNHESKETVDEGAFTTRFI